jgi:hypothetical protein
MHWRSGGSQDGRLQDKVTSGRAIGTHAPIGQADELATRFVAVPRQTITVVIMESKNSPEPLGPDEFLFFVSNQ